MSNKTGQYFICVVEKGKLVSTEKLRPQRMLELVRFLINRFGEQEYDSVVDIFNYWPIDFKAGYKKPVQCLYVDYDKDAHETLGTGFVVYAYSKTKAEDVMHYFLNKED